MSPEKRSNRETSTAEKNQAAANDLPDFDGPIMEIERQIRDLQALSQRHGVDFEENIAALRKQQEEITRALMANLTPWQRVCMARLRDRPTSYDYIRYIFTDFVELHGDRAFADDKAIVTGLGTVDHYKVMVIATEKGHGVREKSERNFGLAHPEGYRKAKLKMLLAERLGLPVVTFIDTQGAFPGIGAEERGQAIAIAENLETMARLRTPIVSFILGEGGSGGALAIGVADRLCALENSYFSVITPEGCSAILWKSADKRQEAAEALKLDPVSLKKLGIIDEIVPEPLGGAHRDHREASRIVKERLVFHLDALCSMDIDELLEERYTRYRNIGRFVEAGEAAI